MTSRPLSSISRVRELLQQQGLNADKAFGQNFLVDGHVLGSILSAADIQDSDHVLEVGPGLGVLTLELAQRAKSVTSIELDKRLAPILEQHRQHHPKLNVVYDDALRYDFQRSARNSLFVANLPYNVATGVVTRALEAQVFRRMVFLVQKEVAERICALPASPAFGSLSLLFDRSGY